MYEESYDEAVDVYAFGMCMLEMATSEYPYNECQGPAQIYKKVVHGIKPESFEKIENPEVKDIIDRCIKLKKTERPSCLELLNSDFFSEDLGIKLEPITKQQFLVDPTCNKIEFRLRLMDPKKRTSKHKENEAIQFDFDISMDNANEITSEMFKSNIINEEDSKAVSKLIQVQVGALIKQRREMMAQQQLDVQKTHYRAKALRAQQMLAMQAAKQVDEEDEDDSSSDYDEECTQAQTLPSDEHELLQQMREQTQPVIFRPGESVGDASDIGSSDKVVRFISDQVNVMDNSEVASELKIVKHKRKSAIKNCIAPDMQLQLQQPNISEIQSNDESMLKTSVQFSDHVQFENEVQALQTASATAAGGDIDAENNMQVKSFEEEHQYQQPQQQQQQQPQQRQQQQPQQQQQNQPQTSDAQLAALESMEIARSDTDVRPDDMVVTQIDNNDQETQQEIYCKHHSVIHPSTSYRKNSYYSFLRLQVPSEFSQTNQCCHR